MPVQHGSSRFAKVLHGAATVLPRFITVYPGSENRGEPGPQTSTVRTQLNFGKKHNYAVLRMLKDNFGKHILYACLFCTVYEPFYKNEGIWEEKCKKITHLILILFHLKLNSKNLNTIIHSFKQENSNNNNFWFILMAAHAKNVIPVTTTMNLIS